MPPAFRKRSAQNTSRASSRDSATGSSRNNSSSNNKSNSLAASANKKLKSIVSGDCIPEAEISACPADVLLGRGKGFYEWQGNVRFQQLIRFYLPAYQAAKNKQEKTKLSETIVALVQHGGGRFLKENRSGKLQEVPDKEARVKVVTALRDRRRSVEGQETTTSSKSVVMNSFTALGVFTGGKNSSSTAAQASVCAAGDRQNNINDAFSRYRDVVSPLWSTRTEDTEPIDSWRSLRTSESCNTTAAGATTNGGASNNTIHNDVDHRYEGRTYVPLALSDKNEKDPRQQQGDDDDDAAAMDALLDPNLFGSVDFTDQGSQSDISSEFSLLDLGAEDTIVVGQSPPSA